MKNTLKSEHPVTNEAAKAATGKTLDQWFTELDQADGLKLGRREINNRLYAQKLDLWWCTTIAVEYERHHDVRKKDDCLRVTSSALRKLSARRPPTFSRPAQTLQILVSGSEPVQQET